MTMTERPRVLIVTRNLPPLVGGMERLNWHMAAELSAVADVRVVGPAEAAASVPGGVRLVGVPLSPLWRFLVAAAVAARRQARSWQPHVILAGSGLTAPIVRWAAQVCRAQTAAYVHGLDVAVQNRVYRSAWWPALRSMDRLVANSRATAALCRVAGVDPERIGVVHPGVALPTDVPDAAQCAAFRDVHGLAGRRLLLSVGRLTERKGLLEFVTHALPRIVKQVPDSALVVVGGAPSHSLHARQQAPDEIRAAAARVGIRDHVHFVGRLTDRELEVAYRSADVHVFPVRELPGDPEGFGMVAIEAAAYGLPTVGFAAGGVTDAIGEGVSGYRVEPGEYAAFADTVVRLLRGDDVDGLAPFQFARAFAWPEFGRRLARELALPADQADDR